MSPLPVTAREVIASKSTTAIILPPTDSRAEQNTVVDKQESNEEATEQDTVVNKLESNEEATGGETTEGTTPIREEGHQRQRSSADSIGPEIRQSVEEEESESVRAAEGEEKQEQEEGEVQDPHQDRSPRDTTISLTPETVPVREEAKEVEEEQNTEQDGNRGRAGFELHKVYDRDEIAKVMEFPYRRLGETRKRKAGCSQPGFVALANKVQQHGKCRIEETWVEWMPLYLTANALDFVEKRYGSVERKVSSQRDGVSCHLVEFKGSWEKGMRKSCSFEALPIAADVCLGQRR